MLQYETHPHKLSRCLTTAIMSLTTTLAPFAISSGPYEIFFSFVSSVSAVHGCLIVKHQISR